MRRAIPPLAAVLVVATASYGQLTGPTMYPGEGGTLMGGLGLTAVDNQTYFSIYLQPEIAIGKIGIGLNVNLLYNTSTGHIRSKDWDENYDYLRLVRYVRYGHKGDPFYARVGALDAARIGHGFLVNYYSNSPSYDERKIGLAFDLDFGTFGFETMANNLGRAEVLGARGYWRPLRTQTSLPIIKNLELGVTYVTDIDPDANRKTDDGVSAFGLDVGLPLLTFASFRTLAYYDFGKIVDYGSGQAAGVSLSLQLPANLAQVYARVERRWLGKEFEAGFFNAFYEVERYTPATGFHKYDGLRFINEETRGIFGELAGDVLGAIRLLGSFVRLDDQPHSGLLHLAADAPNAIPGIAAHASYEKGAVEKFKDLFVLDDHSIARVGLGYKIRPYLIAYVDYIWNFVYDSKTRRYVTQERVEPRLSLVYSWK
ncbi:MAG: hypothetical protein ONB23_02330 [candidate division KSB1 bacterium]|nr:hypothetical protein [candidate division KSB1 bacterium]